MDEFRHDGGFIVHSVFSVGGTCTDASGFAFQKEY